MRYCHSLKCILTTEGGLSFGFEALTPGEMHFEDMGAGSMISEKCNGSLLSLEAQHMTCTSYQQVAHLSLPLYSQPSLSLHSFLSSFYR